MSHIIFSSIFKLRLALGMKLDLKAGRGREKTHKLNKARHCSANSRHAKVVAGVHDALFAVCALPKNMLDVDPI